MLAEPATVWAAPLQDVDPSELHALYAALLTGVTWSIGP